MRAYICICPLLTPVYFKQMKINDSKKTLVISTIFIASAKNYLRYENYF